jgi:hypothetical protein
MPGFMFSTAIRVSIAFTPELNENTYLLVSNGVLDTCDFTAKGMPKRKVVSQ